MKTGQSGPEENTDQAGTYSTYGTQCIINLIPRIQLRMILSSLPRYYVTLWNAPPIILLSRQQVRWRKPHDQGNSRRQRSLLAEAQIATILFKV